MMRHFAKLLMAMVVAAIVPLVANGYDFEENGLFFNLNEDGKSVTLTYNVPILIALDAPALAE